MRAVASVWPYMTKNSAAAPGHVLVVGGGQWRVQGSACLLQSAQRGKAHVPEADPLKQLVGVRDASQACAAVSSNCSQKDLCITLSPETTTAAPANQWLLSTDSPKE